MVQEEIKTLLKKYLYGQLTNEEVVQLKTLIQNMDDRSLEQNLSQLWDTCHVSGKRNIEAFDTISKNMKKIILPQKKISLLGYLGKIAAAAIFLLLITLTSYLYIDKINIQTAITQMYTISAEKGEHASVTLPDGTKVYLNAKSTLSYPASFSLNERTVQLTGEAYFEVVHDAATPFIVKTEEIQIKVLGTTFNLYAYPDDSWFEASLIEGSIEVTPYKNPEKQVYLSPNQKARYNHETGEINVISTDLRVETAWKRGDLIFRNQPFKEIIGQLEIFYGVNITTDGECPEELFTGSYHENDIIQVLKNLQQHYTFKYQKSGNEISLKFTK